MPLLSFVRRSLGAALVAAALSLTISARPAAAQKAHAASGDKDVQTLANYRLTESGFRKFYKAMENVAMAAMKDPALQDSMEGSDNEDIAGMAARLDRVPALKRAINAAGLTSMEYATFTMSYMQASMASALMDGPENMRIKKLPEGTPKENVEFLRTHQDLIKSLDAEVKALEKSLGGAAADTVP